MKEIKLKLAEFMQLFDELAGFNNQEGKQIEGILSSKMSLSTRYWLDNILKQCSTEKESVEKIKNELISKLGTPSEDGQSIMIPTYLESGDINPSFVEFSTEFGKLLEEEKTLTFKEIPVSLLDTIETELHCQVFFKLVEASNQTTPPIEEQA